MYEAGIGWEIRAKTYYWRLSDAVFETCRNSRKLFNIPVLNVATVDALGVIISIRGALLHGKNYHIGVGSNVVYSTGLGNARASTRGMDNRTVHAFYVL